MVGTIYVDDKYQKIIEKTVDIEKTKQLKRFWSNKSFVEFLIRSFLIEEKNEDIDNFVKEVFLNDSDSNLDNEII